jgi:hypothetical protein
MPDRQPSSPNLHDVPHYTEREILYALTNSNDNPPLWALEDLARELGDRIAVEDAAHQLQTSGLIHRTTDGHIFATRAAVRLIQIIGHNV